ncbi:MAG: [LysW]-lysine hydrolase [Phycisphaerales bacterium]
MIGDDACVRFLVDLVATPSVSGRERVAAEVFCRTAAHFGLEPWIDDAGNACARRGDPHADPIVLLGHTDTVPGDIPVRLEGDTLHGRGSVDAKGPLVAFLCAAARAQIPDGCALLVVGAVGEETPRSPGARFLRDRLRPRACIIGEPSGWDGVTLGYKGRLLARAQCTQPCGHSAGPRGSALDTLLDWAAHERAVARTATADAGPFDALQCTARDARTTSDGLADTAALTIGYRLPPGIDPDDLERDLRAGAPAGVEITFEGHERAFVTARTDPVVRALSIAIAQAGARPRHLKKTGTSDMNVVAPTWRCPIAAYGPGDSALDHTPEERLSVGEFLRSIGVVQQAIETLACEPAPAAC